MLLPLYMMNKNISRREKAVKGVLLLVMLLGFSLNIPNLSGTASTTPTSLPARQSFLYIILLLAMCYEAYKNIRANTGAQLAGSSGARPSLFSCARPLLWKRILLPDLLPDPFVRGPLRAFALLSQKQEGLGAYAGHPGGDGDLHRGQRQHGRHQCIHRKQDRLPGKPALLPGPGQGGGGRGFLAVPH